MKKQIKKLQLSRETLTVLEPELKSVDGGAAPPSYLCTQWQSKCFCYT